MSHLNSLTYISDYHELGVEGLLVGNDEVSSRHSISLDFEKMLDLSKYFEVYVQLNLLYSEKELPLLEKWIRQIAHTKIAGIVFQDFAVLSLAKKYALSQKLMYAPETLNTNHMTLDDLKGLGVNEAFLAREISVEDIVSMAEKSQLDLMVQVHGIMYMAQSRRPLLTNYSKENGLLLERQKYILKAKDSPLKAWIFEDDHGTNVETYSELCALDFLNLLNTGKMTWFYVDTQMMDEYRALEIISLYHDAVVSLNQGTFLKDIHAYRPILNHLMEGHEADSGFYNEKTVYKLEDVRMKDNEKRNQSNH